MAKRSSAGNTAKRAGNKAVTVGQVCAALEQLAPLKLAQSWDNVGLLAGDTQATVRRVLLCIDLTAAVVAEARRRRAQLVMAYHPPIFKPISRLVAQARGATGGLPASAKTGPAGPEADVCRCLMAGIAIYSMHTALDAAEGGTNDVLAQLCGVTETEPIEYVQVAEPLCKVVVFVPGDAADRVAQAIFAAGAGRIGEYSRCSYWLAGEGTFCGSALSHPAIGRAGQFERVAEVRIESVAPRSAMAAITAAIRASHPYEEPAFDFYPLEAPMVRGIGRVGPLPQTTTLGTLARRLAGKIANSAVQIVGPAQADCRRAIICVGAAGRLPLAVKPGPGDVIVTGEIRHHDALTILRHGASAIALGHWASERPALTPLARRLGELVPKVQVEVAQADRDPFGLVRR